MRCLAVLPRPTLCKIPLTILSSKHSQLISNNLKGLTGVLTLVSTCQSLPDDFGLIVFRLTENFEDNSVKRSVMSNVRRTVTDSGTWVELSPPIWFFEIWRNEGH